MELSVKRMMCFQAIFRNARFWGIMLQRWQCNYRTVTHLRFWFSLEVSTNATVTLGHTYVWYCSVPIPELMLHNFIGCEGLNKLACIRCSSTGNVKEYYNLLNELWRISTKCAVAMIQLTHIYGSTEACKDLIGRFSLPRHSDDGRWNNLLSNTSVQHSNAKLLIAEPPCWTEFVTSEWRGSEPMNRIIFRFPTQIH